MSMTYMTTSCSMWLRVARIPIFKNNISCTQPARTSECLGLENERNTSMSMSNHRLLTPEITRSGWWPILCINIGKHPLSSAWSSRPRHAPWSRDEYALVRYIRYNTWWRRMFPLKQSTCMRFPFLLKRNDRADGKRFSHIHSGQVNGMFI